MTVETPERDWTDDRIGGLDKKVDEGLKKVDERFDEVDKRLVRADEKLDSKIGEVRREMKAGFDRLEDKFDRKFDQLNGRLLVGAGSVIATLIGAIVAHAL